jgi:hypothetical protein
MEGWFSEKRDKDRRQKPDKWRQTARFQGQAAHGRGKGAGIDKKFSTPLEPDQNLTCKRQKCNQIGHIPGVNVNLLSNINDFVTFLVETSDTRRYISHHCRNFPYTAVRLFPKGHRHEQAQNRRPADLCRLCIRRRSGRHRQRQL